MNHIIGSFYLNEANPEGLNNRFSSYLTTQLRLFRYQLMNREEDMDDSTLVEQLFSFISFDRDREIFLTIEPLEQNNLIQFWVTLYLGEEHSINSIVSYSFRDILHNKECQDELEQLLYETIQQYPVNIQSNIAYEKATSRYQELLKQPSKYYEKDNLISSQSEINTKVLREERKAEQFYFLANAR